MVHVTYKAWKVIYPLPEILLIVLGGTMAGAEDFSEIERWAVREIDVLRRLLLFERGVPSHDTLNDVMNALPPTLFADCFTTWVEALRDDDPDIVAIPLLLERLELTGALVTIDAIGCQRDIAAKIRAEGADYLLALKDDRPTLAEEARLFFDREPDAAFDTHETTDGDHGRIEIRRHRVATDVAWLTTDRRFPGEPRFPGLAMIGMVESRVERDGRSATARRYDLSSAVLDASTFARAVRAHWGSRTASTGRSTSSSTTVSCG